MKLYKTIEGYVNVLQEKTYDWIILISIIKNKISEMEEKYDEENEAVVIETYLYTQKELEVFSIGLGDIENVLIHEEIIIFLSNILKIDNKSLKELDYLNLRRF